MTKLCNAFSLQMVNTSDFDVEVRSCQAPVGEALESCIGHQDTANVLSSVLGVAVPMNRCNVSLSKGDSIIVAQFVGSFG